MASPLLQLGQQKQLLNHVVDITARDAPEKLYAEYPISSTSYDEGFRKITFAAFANAINGVAWWLHNTIGPGNNFDTLAYLGVLDMRYNTLLLGAVKAGYKVLFTSPRNSMPAHVNLFNLLDCQVLIAPSPRPQAVTAIAECHDIRVLEIPSVEELLGNTYPPYPYEKSFETARKEPLVVLHTSGTTGLPKPIIWTHDFAASWLHWITLEPPPGYKNHHDLWSPGRLFFLFPPFHAAALFGSLLGAIFLKTTVVFPPAGVIPSAQVLADGLKHTKADCAAIVPLVADELSKKPELLDYVSGSLTSMFYSGGSVGQAVGDNISLKMKFFSIMGSTENGLFPTLYPAERWPTEDWNYIRFNPAANVNLEKISDDEFEAVVKRHQSSEIEQPIFTVFPHEDQYRTGDLYYPHPTKPDLWLYRGRSDDIIVFLTGEKTNPISMEEAIARHPEVRSVLVIGTLRFQAALLVELLAAEQYSTSQRAEIIERLWPTIQEANLECPRHAIIKKSHIMFTTPDKPMQRAGKGTIQRKPTFQLYAQEIDKLYEDADETSASFDTDGIGSTVTLDPSDSKAISAFISDSLAHILDVKSVEDDENFFLSGMDSLQAVQMTRRLKAALSVPDLEISTVYANPSISALTKAIMGLSKGHVDSTELRQISRSQTIENMLAGYKGVLDKISHSHNVNPPARQEELSYRKGRTILITGSTGVIGSYMLQELLNTQDVSHIYCLNRASDSSALQVSRNKARNLPTEFPSSRITFLAADLSKDSLGLNSNDYEKLRTSVTDIIHNAWPVNFNLSLATFKPHLSGIVNLLKLASSAARPFNFLFISSVSSVLGSSIDPVPEEIIFDPLAPLPIGYGESKHIAEVMLDYASTLLSNANVIVVRVNQVTGPAYAPGHWNKWEWFPSLVTSSLYLGMLPDSLGNGQDVIDWIPIDILARTLVEFVLAGNKDDGANTTKVFHPLNPRPTSWSKLRPVVLNALREMSTARGDVKGIKEVPFSTWVESVRKEARAMDGTSQLERMLQVNPAVKLVGFYEGLMSGEGVSQINGKKAAEASKLLGSLNGLEAEWLRRWINDWVN